MSSRALAATTVLLLLGAFSAPAHAEGDATGDDETAGSVGPSVVSVPYEGSVEVSPAGGWQFIDCAALEEQVPLVTQCAADGFTVAAPEYDADAEPQRVNIAMRGPAGPTEIPYIVQLAPPMLPEGSDTTFDMPVPAGGRTLIPLSHVDPDCELCSPGTARVQVAGVDADAPLEASVTGTHLSLVPHPDARGEAQVNLRIIDDLGQPSKTFIVTLRIVDPERLGLRSLHRTVPPGESLELDASDLVFRTDGESVEVAAVSCAVPLHGSVHCTPEGHLTYTPAADEVLDQFAVRVLDTEGREALASVTLSAHRGLLAPGTGSRETEVLLDLPHIETTPGTATGVTAGFTTLMDALGAQ